MKLALYVDPATAACSSCPAPCCAEHDINVNGFDLVRLSRGLGLPWRTLVHDVEQEHGLSFGFRLDSGPTHHHLYLRRRTSGACQFLLEIDGSWRRCGVHGLRPGACRVYPLKPSGIAAHAVCPPAQRQLYDDARATLQALVDDDEGEVALWARVLERWDLRARTVPKGAPLAMDVFVEWLDGLYGAVESLRRGDRGEWQLAAYALIDEFALPC